jgi:uncharacterized protein (TIGR02600 family)
MNKRRRLSKSLPTGLSRSGGGIVGNPIDRTGDHRVQRNGHKGEIRGAALIIVLAFLVIITGLVVAFLSSITNESTGSKATADASTTRTLADSTIQLAIAQIRDATTGFARDSNGALVTATNVTWASQPGAIRTYDTRGSNVAVYKLYSSTNMVERSGIYNPTNDLPPTNWTTGNIGQWVDLNEPVVAQGVTNYPIMHPMLAMTNPNSGAVNTTNYVDGFFIATNNTAVGGTNVQNRAAMPVPWLYVLRDGSITVPSSITTNNGLISFSASAIRPTSNNPIVARIAFWTDDETCKLNLNTASEGSFWGTPYYCTSFDVAMAQYPPSAREYNRFPGHPASTCLSPVLWNKLGLTNPAMFLSAYPGIPTYPSGIPGYNTLYNGALGVASNTLESRSGSYYSNILSMISPRYAWGGSEAGSKILVSGMTANTNLLGDGISPSDLSSSRLYSSVDEFFFNPTNSYKNKNLNRASNCNSYKIVSGDTNLSPQDVACMRFFLTTTSRAPEVNPQNLPKICMWPVAGLTNKIIANPWSQPGNTRTIYDKTIAFSSTLGGNLYYTTRYDATTSKNDFSLRNGVLYSYLRNCLDQPVPGFPGGSFTTTKWTSQRADQITTLLFDYIRSCINLHDVTGAQFDTNGNISSQASVIFSYTRPCRPTFTTNTTTLAVTTNTVLDPGTGQVVPMVVNNGTKGIGRFPTLRGASLLFMARAADQPPLMLNPDRRPRVFKITGNVATEISNWDGTSTTIPVESLTNIVMKGQAYALVNPMHPWTCPPMQPWVVTNAIITGKTANMSTNNWIFGGGKNFTNCESVDGLTFFNKTNVLVPQLCTPNNIPVLADSAPANTNKDLSSTDSSNATALFPIFDLSADSVGMPISDGTSEASSRTAPYTKTFPCLSSVNPIANNTEGDLESYFWVTAKTNDIKRATNTAGNTNYSYLAATNMVAMRAITEKFTNFTPLNPARVVITHPGLPYLSVPSSSTGRYNLTNANFIDGNATNIPLYGTRMEALYLPDLVNVASGQIGMDPNIRLDIDHNTLRSFKVNGQTMSFPSSPASGSRTGGFGRDLEGRYVYSLGLQYLMGSTLTDPTRVIQTYTTDGSNSKLIATNQTFEFRSDDLPIKHEIKTTAGDIVQTANLVFPDATFATPTLPCTTYKEIEQSSASPRCYPPDRAFYLVVTQPSFHISRPNDRLTAPLGRDQFEERYNIPSYMNCSESSRSNSWFPSPMGVSYSSQTHDDSYFWYTRGMNRITADTIQSVELKYGDPRIVSCLTNIPTNAYAPNPNYGDTNQYTIRGWPVYLRNAHSMRSGRMPINGGMYGSFMVVTNSSGVWTNSYLYPPMVRGWYRSGTKSLSTFVPPSARMMGEITFDNSAPNIFTNPNNFCGYMIPRMWDDINPEGFSSYPFASSDCSFNNTNSPFFTIWSKGGDFDNGIAANPDGPMINKVDEGMGATNNWQGKSVVPYFTVVNPKPAGSNTFSPNRMVASPVIFGSLPTLDNAWAPANPVLTITNSSWQTLQFSPNPNALDTNFFARRTSSNGYSDAGMRPNNSVLPDHLLLDYFWMPVVEPYPISEPFSTAGKVNMNYAIAPFSYINRDSAMRGVLKSVMISAVDDRWSYDYKLRNLLYFDDNDACIFSDPRTNNTPAGIMNNQSYNDLASNTGQFYFHYPIHLNETLKQFDYRFTNGTTNYISTNATGDLFRSPSEICTLWLYPARLTNTVPFSATNSLVSWDVASSNIERWWYDSPGMFRKGLTGDNVRERPYNYLYPRLTTKSNTYQIHYRVQLLKQSLSAISTWPSTPRSRDASGWTLFIDPSNTSRTIRDQVVGELRGSATIERYIDPSDTSLPDFAASNAASTNNFTNPACIMDTYYKFRVFNFKVFTP